MSKPDRDFRRLQRRLEKKFLPKGFKFPKGRAFDPAWGAPKPFGKHKTPRTFGQIAFWNNYGAPGRPPTPRRPFFTTTIEQNRNRYADNLEAIAVQVAEGQFTTDEGLKRQGDIIRRDLNAAVLKWFSPPNAEFTKLKKGFNNPLVETRQLATRGCRVVLGGRHKTDSMLDNYNFAFRLWRSFKVGSHMRLNLFRSGVFAGVL